MYVCTHPQRKREHKYEHFHSLIVLPDMHNNSGVGPKAGNQELNPDLPTLVAETQLIKPNLLPLMLVRQLYLGAGAKY